MYYCVHCQNQGKKYHEARYRVVGHILKHHLPLDRAPFYCTLCMFRSLTKDQLVKHVAQYKRHVKLAADMGILDHSRFLVENQDYNTIQENVDFKTMEQNVQPEDPLTPQVTNQRQTSPISTLSTPIIQIPVPDHIVKATTTVMRSTPAFKSPFTGFDLLDALLPDESFSCFDYDDDEPVSKKAKSSDEQTPATQTDPQTMTSTTVSCVTNAEPESQPASNLLLESLLKMSDKIVEAIDRNSRAVRCLETHHLKMAENMSKINRSLERIGEEMRRENLRREERQKTHQESINKRKSVRPEDRENIPALKSIVNHSYQRR